MAHLEQKHPRFIRWNHWVNFPLLSIMIFSGLYIYWAHDPYRIGWGDYTLIKFFPDWFYSSLGLAANLANGIAWHFFFMWFFILNGALYIIYTLASGEWRFLLPNRHSLKEAIQVTLHDLRLSSYHPPRKKFNGAQQIAYTSIVLTGIGSVVTGLAIYKPVQLSWLTWLLGGYEMARWEHFWLMMSYLFFFVIHIAQVIRAGLYNFLAMVTGVELIKDKNEKFHE